MLPFCHCGPTVPERSYSTKNLVDPTWHGFIYFISLLNVENPLFVSCSFLTGSVNSL